MTKPRTTEPVPGAFLAERGEPVMEDSPTTFNGLLHSPAANLDDRRIIAIFAGQAAANEARERLVKLGIPVERIELFEHAEDDPEASAANRPADRNVIGKIRRFVWPDHGYQAYRDAIRHGDAILEVHPRPEEAETVVRTLEATHPKHFDARLELWRNAAGR
jgi:hypothetical protein